MLSYELQLVKENGNLLNSCKQHLHNASFNILKDISAAALSKTKAPPRKLHSQRDHLFRDNEKKLLKPFGERLKNRW